MARHGRYDQRTLLQSHETASAEFINHFRVSHSLSQALATERKSSAVGQAAFLRKKALQGAYVESARSRPKLPPMKFMAQQEVIMELRRDAVTVVPIADETASGKAAREAKRQALFDSRKAKHDEAEELYERDLDTMVDRCKAEAHEATKRMRHYVEEADAHVESLLHPLEADTEGLGNRSEEDVHEVMASLDGVTVARKDRIEEFAGELARIDHRRREEGTALVKQMVERCTACAHLVQGELERLVEKKTLALNDALLENEKAAKAVQTKLMVQTLEKSKENKVRFQRGLLLWRQLRHRHSIGEVFRRIESTEFSQPKALEDILARFRAEQRSVFEQRAALLDECFGTPLKILNVSTVTGWKERSTSLYDSSQEGFDALLGEFKELKDKLDVTAESMLSVLGQVLESHDARQEWGDHESVADLINADVRPKLHERLDSVRKLLHGVNEAFSQQDESQNNDVLRVLKFFANVAKKQEQLNKGAQDVDISYRSDIDECEDTFNAEWQSKEQRMNMLLRKDMAECVHHEALEELRTSAFEELDAIAMLYRDHEETVTKVHEGYPERVAKFFQPEAEGFCSELGLVTAEELEAQREKTAEESGTPPEEGSSEPVEWPRGAGSGCRVLEIASVADVRAKILTFKLGDEEAEDLAAALGPEVDAEADEAIGDTEEATTIPRTADGVEALASLRIEDAWLEERIENMRGSVFSHLATVRKQLDQVDVAAEVEKMRQWLDHQLRKHTNRKGEVQVEYYMPRYSTITKHQDKFERHIIEIARKSQDQDDTVINMFETLDEEEASYKEKLVELSTRFGEAESLASLASIQREANDRANKFTDVVQTLKTRLSDLSRAPGTLKKENQAFIDRCTGKGETYSNAEINYYRGELNELNDQLDERARERKRRMQELEAKLDDMRRVPLTAFKEQYLKAEDDLKAAKGLGREHGEPRREARKECRTLNAWGADARERITSLFDHLASISNLDVDENMDLASLPTYEFFNFKEFFRRQMWPWFFTAEVVGTLSITVCALNAMGTHLGAFQEAHAARYKLESVRLMRVLKEDEAAPNEADEAGRTAESELRQTCLANVLGNLLGSPTHSAVIDSIVESAHETYKAKSVSTPEFMLTFLKEMKELAHATRMEAAIGVREMCDQLRTDVILKLGTCVFRELAARAVRDLRSHTQRAQDEFVAEWSRNDGERQAHESALNPKLANPNNEKDLVQLVEQEADRYDKALLTVVADRARVADCLRAEADAFVNRLAARFEVMVAFLDAVPLHTHFKELPGDEQVEAPRMSIKRRMRRLSAGQNVEHQGDALPEKSWCGFPRCELRGLLRGGENSSWPEDPTLAQATPETLAEGTPAVASFRSPAHKHLYECRNASYEHFRASFVAEVERQDARLKAREKREEVGQTRWESMVQKLNGEVVAKAWEERQRRLDAEKEAEAPPAPIVPEPKAKGKK